MRRALLITIPVLVLATAAWFLLLFNPAGTRITESEDQLIAAEDEGMALRTQLAKLRKIQDNEFAYLEAIGVIEAAIPPTPELDVVIEDLHELAVETGIQWRAVSNGVPAPVEGQRYFEFPMTITVEGQYFELLGYLYGIADLPRLVVIDSISISSAQDEQGFTILTVGISARVFTTSGIVVPDFGKVTTTTSTTTTTAPPEGA